MAERKWFKGPAALAVDDWYSSGSVEENLAEGERYLRSGQSFAEIVRALSGTPRGRTEFIHPYDGSTLQGPEFESVTRQGYLKAIELALRDHDRDGDRGPVPIETFWMTGAGNDTFEMHVTDGPDRVSLTLLVPDVEGGSHYPRSPEAWVVRIGGDGQTETVQTSGPTSEAPLTRDLGTA